MFEGLKDVGKLLKDAKDMKKKMKAVQDELKRTVVMGQSKDGLVKVEMTGELQVTSININESLISSNSKKNIENKILESINDASFKAKKIASGQLEHISKGLNIPGM